MNEPKRRSLLRYLGLAIITTVTVPLAGIFLVVAAAMLSKDVNDSLAKWLANYRPLEGEYVDGAWHAEVPSAFGHRRGYSGGRLTFIVESGCETDFDENGFVAAIRCGPDETAPEVSLRTVDGSWTAGELRLLEARRVDEDALRIRTYNAREPEFYAVRIRVSGDPEIRAAVLRQSK